MANNYKYNGCSAVLSSLTAAQKAQKVLSAAAIPTSVGKIHSSNAHRGCAWSVSFSCNQRENVERVLSIAGIAVRSWESGNDIS